MLATLLLTLFQDAPQIPFYFNAAVVLLVIAGGIGWLIAAIIGIRRAPAFGASIRWFALAAVCLVIYHLQWITTGFALWQNDIQLALIMAAFFNLFVALGAVCVIIGLLRLTDLPR